MCFTLIFYTNYLKQCRVSKAKEGRIWPLFKIVYDHNLLKQNIQNLTWIKINYVWKQHNTIQVLYTEYRPASKPVTVLLYLGLVSSKMIF